MPIKYDEKGSVKRPEMQMAYTQAMLSTYANCAKSIEFFAEKFYYILGKRGREIIHLREYQKRMLKSYVENQFSITLCGRQMGKTVSISVFALWYCFFNKDKSIAILAHKAEMSKEILANMKFAYEQMPSYMKPGVKEYNAFSIEFDNGCSIVARATHPDAVRGLSLNVLILDEFAFVPENIADEFYTSNYPTLSATEGKMIVISTPKGTSNLYYRLWKASIDKENNFCAIKVDWWENPERDENWKDKMIRDIGRIRFNQEFGCQFHGSSVTLIDGNFIVEKLKPKEIKFKPDDFTTIWETAQNGHKYLISVDTAGGVGSDFSTMNVFDITESPQNPMRQVAVYRRNTITPPAFAEVVHDSAEYWNNAYVIGELNGLSQEVINRLFDAEYPNIYFDYEDDTYGIWSDRSSKPKAAMWFKEDLEQGKMILCDPETINEIGYFEEIKPGVYKAKPGKNNHDDMVITCIWADLFIRSQYFLDERDEWAKEIQQYDDNDESTSLFNEKTEKAAEAEEALSAFLEKATQQTEYDNENWLMDDEIKRYKQPRK